MLEISEVVVVEGKYDKKRLTALCRALIISTDGFRIFKNKEKTALLRRLAKERGLLILTDSDRAGFLIRHHLKGIIEPRYIKNAYIPEIFGKERRKAEPSAEGKLGVEGMSEDILKTALLRAGATPRAAKGREITKADLYGKGLSGGQDSAQKRALLCEKLSLPAHMSTNELLDVLNAIMSYEEFNGL